MIRKKWRETETESRFKDGKEWKKRNEGAAAESPIGLALTIIGPRIGGRRRVGGYTLPKGDTADSPSGARSSA